MATKSWNNKNEADTKKNVSDVKVVGNTDLFQLLCKASSESEGWMESTKAMQVEGWMCCSSINTKW